MAEESASAEASQQSTATGSEILHVPKAVFIEDVAAFLEGMFWIGCTWADELFGTNHKHAQMSLSKLSSIAPISSMLHFRSHSR